MANGSGLLRTFGHNAILFYVLRAISLSARTAAVSTFRGFLMAGRKLGNDVDRDAPAFRIASRWGGVAGFAAALGRPFTTVRGWVASGDIPPGEQEAVIAAAKRDKVKPAIKPTDFVDDRKFDVAPAPPVEQAVA